jgi:hypothetical protein
MIQLQCLCCACEKKLPAGSKNKTKKPGIRCPQSHQVLPQLNQFSLLAAVTSHQSGDSSDTGGFFVFFPF